eukprot:scaffold76261_cov33-Tisochrysis_lutea.AAC.10
MTCSVRLVSLYELRCDNEYSTPLRQSRTSSWLHTPHTALHAHPSDSALQAAALDSCTAEPLVARAGPRPSPLASKPGPADRRGRPPRQPGAGAVAVVATVPSSEADELG